MCSDINPGLVLLALGLVWLAYLAGFELGKRLTQKRDAKGRFTK